MLQCRNRLRRKNDIQSVYRTGRRWRSPTAMLIVRANGLEVSRFAFAAGRGAGKAVARNHAKRRAREVIRRHLSEVEQGWDCLVVLFPAARSASFGDLESHLHGLLTRARILRQEGA